MFHTHIACAALLWWSSKLRNFDFFPLQFRVSSKVRCVNNRLLPLILFYFHPFCCCASPATAICFILSFFIRLLASFSFFRSIFNLSLSLSLILSLSVRLPISAFFYLLPPARSILSHCFVSYVTLTKAHNKRMNVFV